MTTVFDDLPPSAFWRSGVVEPGPADLTGLFQPKFRITRDMAVATAGSCFAQHVGRALRSAGLNVLDVEPAPPGLDDAAARSFGFNLYSARYGNIYTPRQLRQLVVDTAALTLRDEAFWTRDTQVIDALRPNVEPEGCTSLAEARALRLFHLGRLATLFTRTELFVFTLGMTESWEDSATGTIFPSAPGVLAAPPADRSVIFRNFSFSEILQDLAAIRQLLQAFNPAMRFLLTVSPVPLTATASGRHVLQATTTSKAILRAALDEFCRDKPDVDYVPSYEVINHPAARGRFFTSNLRSVTPEGVSLVMANFLHAHGLSPASEAATPAPAVIEAEPDFEVICEEALAEAFLR